MLWDVFLVVDDHDIVWVEKREEATSNIVYFSSVTLPTSQTLSVISPYHITYILSCIKPAELEDFVGKV